MEIPRIESIASVEARAFVELPIPGKVGSVYQDMNSAPTRIRIAGSLYGDEARDQFLEEVRGMERKNLALELLKKILNDEIKERSKKNLIQGRKLSEMLERTIKKYQNNLITAAQVIEELIGLAKDIRAEDKRFEGLGLSLDEIAFYDALAENGSARDVLGDEQLRALARVLVEKVKTNTSIDWTIKESVQAKLRVLVKRTLRQYGYPPDLEKMAIDNVLKQSAMLADEWAEE